MPFRLTGSEIQTRILSGLVMAFATIASMLAGGWLFSLLVAFVGAACLREWHRLVDARADGWQRALERVANGLAILGAIALASVSPFLLIPILLIVLGASIAALLAYLRNVSPLWHALGAFYIGLPCVSMVALRAFSGRGAAVVGALFVAIWAADTGAWFWGRLFGGPKLAPLLSPNKTWAGFVGGTLTAGLAEALYVALLGGAPAKAAVLGISIGMIGHCGDLFESWVKRRFQAKNTGTLIPGHGGMLDRVDSLLFAAPVAAFLVLGLGFNTLFGGAP